MWGYAQKVRRSVASALGAIGSAAESVSAKTAFTLPAPPFELLMVPSASGNWTVMVGMGGEYKPDFEGHGEACSTRCRVFPSFATAPWNSFPARATVRASCSSTSVIFALAPSESSRPHAETMPTVLTACNLSTRSTRSGFSMARRSRLSRKEQPRPWRIQER